MNVVLTKQRPSLLGQNRLPFFIASTPVFVTRVRRSDKTQDLTIFQRRFKATTLCRYINLSEFAIKKNTSFSKCQQTRNVFALSEIRNDGDISFHYPSYSTVRSTRSLAVRVVSQLFLNFSKQRTRTYRSLAFARRLYCHQIFFKTC